MVAQLLVSNSQELKSAHKLSTAAHGGARTSGALVGVIKAEGAPGVSPADTNRTKDDPGNAIAQSAWNQTTFPLSCRTSRHAGE